MADTKTNDNQYLHFPQETDPSDVVEEGPNEENSGICLLCYEIFKRSQLKLTVNYDFQTT